MAATIRTGLDQSQEPGIPPGFPMFLEGTQTIKPSPASQEHNQEAGSGVELLGFQLALIRDVKGVKGGGLTHYVTMTVPTYTF